MVTNGKKDQKWSKISKKYPDNVAKWFMNLPKAEQGDRDCCPKCTGKVFEAEKMVTASVSDFS